MLLLEVAAAYRAVRLLSRTARVGASPPWRLDDDVDDEMMMMMMIMVCGPASPGGQARESPLTRWAP